MRTVVVLLLCSLAVVQLSRAGDQPKKTEKFESLKVLVESGKFVFQAQSANPLSGGKIDLTSPYTLTMNGDSVNSWLPYFGRAYRVSYGDHDGGIKFNDIAQDLSVEYDEKKKHYDVSFQVKTKEDSYRMYLTIGMGGYANLSVTSNNRQSISYYGTIDGLDEGK